MTIEQYVVVSDQDLRSMTQIAVTRRLKGNCAAFSRLAGVSDSLVSALVNQGRFPVEPRVRHLVYTTALGVIENRIRVRLNDIRRTVNSPDGAAPKSSAPLPQPRPQLQPKLNAELVRPKNVRVFSPERGEKLSPLSAAFCRDNVLTGPDYTVRTKALYERYVSWHTAQTEDGTDLGPLLNPQRFGPFLRLTLPNVQISSSRGVLWGK